MNLRLISALLLLLLSAALLLSCGGNANTSQNCGPIALTVSPANGMADHTAIAPGNQVQYSGMEQYPPGCVVPAAVPSLVPVLTWTTSDTVNTSITNAPGAAPGVATCINATPQPATITGSLPDGSLKGTATLTCK